MLRIRVETPCRPTENLGKVKVALLNLFPDLAFDREDEIVSGTTGTLDRLRELIRNQKIRDTARSQFVAGRRENRTRVVLSKQAAYMGFVNFAAGAALGDIVVELTADDLTAAIDYVAESTVDRALKPSGRTEGT